MRVIKLEPKKFSDSIFSMKGISKKTVEEHLKLYQGYVNKYNEIQEKLSALKDDDYAKANQVFSNIRELKVELSFAWGGVVNHEIYFSHLGGKGGKPAGKLLKQIKKDFSSFENYKKDLKATGISARGWVFTGWNKREGRLFNYLSDSQNTYMMWGVRPILALDTYEHAYFIDYGVNRGSYIDAFFENLDWSLIEKRFEKVISSCRSERNPI
ncbi:superoxide dismutase [Candidatus Roizmanbacteria bacterium CG22_combo_CG10-13_8_21_14_all_35_9]|uniref:Superoxide dismutase n=2 Tax=Candidatus Roizmaniibacteriota TaxID=1752723 RepID=A0A2H0BZZ4_9BACT|nr:MAG: superoxide dismutase [Candidatus Roizmanbacteria bacterium CG22_combo_CG10-13_8_21_14_all_35_9]